PAIVLVLRRDAVLGDQQWHAESAQRFEEVPEAFGIHLPAEVVALADPALQIERARRADQARQLEPGVSHEVAGVVVDADEIERATERQALEEPPRYGEPPGLQRVEEQLVEEKAAGPRREPVERVARMVGRERQAMLRHAHHGVLAAMM